MLRWVVARRSAVWEIDQASTRSREEGVGIESSFASIDFSGVAIIRWLHAYPLVRIALDSGLRCEGAMLWETIGNDVVIWRNEQRR